MIHARVNPVYFRHATTPAQGLHVHSRRDFLALITGVGLAGMTALERGFVRAALARAQSRGAATNLFDVEKVAEDVYAALARPAAMINSNAAIFVNANDVVVMDTHSKPSAAAALIAQIRKEITSKPVRYVVNSHFHWDHMQGNSAYRQAFPKVDFLASEATRRLMAQEGGSRLKASLRDLPAEIEKTRKHLETAKKPEEKVLHQKLLAEQEAYAKEMVLPYAGDGYPREWPKTIDVVGKFAFQHVIGGHGPVHHDRIRFQHMREYIEELTAKVAEGKKSGKNVAELQKTLTEASFRSLQTDGYAALVREALAKFTPVFGGSTSLADGIRDNIKDVYNTLDKA